MYKTINDILPENVWDLVKRQEFVLNSPLLNMEITESRWGRLCIRTTFEYDTDLLRQALKADDIEILRPTHEYFFEMHRKRIERSKKEIVITLLRTRVETHTDLCYDPLILKSSFLSYIYAHENAMEVENA